MIELLPVCQEKSERYLMLFPHVLLMLSASPRMSGFIFQVSNKPPPRPPPLLLVLLLLPLLQQICLPVDKHLFNFAHRCSPMLNSLSWLFVMLPCPPQTIQPDFLNVKY